MDGSGDRQYVYDHPLNVLPTHVHPVEALLAKPLDPGLQTSHDSGVDTDNDVQHQPEVDRLCLLLGLQCLPRSLVLHVEADGAQVAGEGIHVHSVLILAVLGHTID